VATFTVCWTISTEGTIVIEAETLDDAKTLVEKMPVRHLFNNGDTQHESIDAPDGWEGN
jgi:hypothetical protein